MGSAKMSAFEEEAKEFETCVVDVTRIQQLYGQLCEAKRSIALEVEARAYGGGHFLGHWALLEGDQAGTANTPARGEVCRTGAGLRHKPKPLVLFRPRSFGMRHEE